MGHAMDVLLQNADTPLHVAGYRLLGLDMAICLCACRSVWNRATTLEGYT